MSSDAVRYEHDLLGDRAVPAGAYYGVHTLRALENFPITGTAISIYPELVSALERVGHERGDYAFLHPLDHVNMSQSTNDVYPTAVNVALHFGIQRLTAAMEALRGASAAKAA